MKAGPSSPPAITCLLGTIGDPSLARVIPWALPAFSGSETLLAPPENPHSRSSPSLHSPSSEGRESAMAYQRADPGPFVPRGLNPIQVQGRKPMEWVVLMKPRAKNQNLAIISIEPMPAHQVTFQAIRNVVTDFLENVLRVEFTDMQPTHLGQAYIRFRNVLDKDRLIHEGPFLFGDVTITFVDHNRGRNWRAVNFNRECWLMLLGFLPDYREDEFVVNTSSSFGRVLSWVDDSRHLARLIVKARVIDYESVPQFIVLTEGEGFQGESWTLQCEILQGQLLGGLPQDEDPAPGPDDFPQVVLLISSVLDRWEMGLLVESLAITLNWNKGGRIRTGVSGQSKTMLSKTMLK